MTFTVLNVAYPLAPVGPDSVGGAEQMVWQMDRALVEAGHRSIVLACESSTVQGKLLSVPSIKGPIIEPAQHEAQQRHRRAIRSACERWPIDLVHMHGIDFHGYLPPPGVPVLVTLHLPPHWYPPHIFQLRRPNTNLHCVSSAQRRSCPASDLLLPTIENGVDLERWKPCRHKRSFAIALGRICPEKGFHLALEAAREAGVPLILGGQVYDYPSHRRYFAEEIVPRLDAQRRFVGPLGGRRKRRLLAAARCLLTPSRVAETSSLVAMEALASGTPVIAYPSGALSEIVEPGRTGFLVQSVPEMIEALQTVKTIDPAVCRKTAEDRFSAERTRREYLATYERLARTSASYSRSKQHRVHSRC